jgi:hypothetical protein
MRTIVLGMLALSLSGCVITDREALFYTRADIDAINARSECRMLARNLVQIARCDGR